jgi:hypothetical protein
MSDKELLKTLKSFRSGVLDKSRPKNMCFAVCAAFQGFISMCGVNLELEEVELVIDNDTYQHYILLLPDGRILDPTASQFDNPNGEPMPEIYLGKRPDWYLKLNNEKALTQSRCL